MIPPATPVTYTPTATAVTYTPPAMPVTYGLDASTFRFSVARYQRMIETGILTSEDKVELLENYVVLKIPRNPRVRSLYFTHNLVTE